jgi:hypothetical protein
MKFFNLCFLVCVITVPASGIVLAGSRPKEQESAPPEDTQKALPSVRKNVAVLTDLDDPLIAPIIDFIDTVTGLSLSLPKEKHLPDGQYDLYMGACTPEHIPAISDYRSPVWEKTDSSFHRQGVFVWAQWHSSVAINTLFFDDREIVVSRLLTEYTGKLTTLNPIHDSLMLLVFYTLAEIYGNEIIEELCGVVPIFQEERNSLAFSIESGQYPIALGIDGYFRKSISEGYPLELSYAPFGEDKYPRTTVRGENIAFIPDHARNMQGAKHVIDFLGDEIFQRHLEGTCFTPVLHRGEEREDSARSTGNVIPAKCSAPGLEEFKKLWLETAYPEGVKNLIPQPE